MQTKHQPNEDFVARLESRLAGEVRRRMERPSGLRWLPSTPGRLLVALAVIVMVSMVAGGAVVDATYRAQNNERRELILSLYQQRLDIAKQGLTMAETELDRARRRESIGAGNRSEVSESQVKHAQALSAFRVAELQLEEVRLSGVEPAFTLSAPRVQGRDFVSARLMAELEALREVFRVADTALQYVSRRVEIGVATPIDREVARAAVIEARSAAALTERKLSLRSSFLKGHYDATQVDLHGYEADAIERLESLRPGIDLARRQVSLVESRVKKGLSEDIELAQVKLKVMMMESELAKAELELALIRKRLSGKAP
jgi:hypothetical protein